ncbi:MAG: TIGR00725 family protein [Candidatus Aminicenantes bacterium]|nr:MAG: TIGR00725 family protein [Candidatus Aminicenantes bacterium]RLE03908.1 MAG: TIGR00725 family protein [Candidatus Aminicenantes bacterium]HHF42728.1 TIGR00725 family protein [Candidatus Aminicenantes bacterium]
MIKSTLRHKFRIAVIGGAVADQEALAAAYRIGQLIAEKGGILICGGLGGVMEAASRGAKEKGGLTVGILPGASHKEANPYIDLPLATALGHTRNSLVALNADVIIAVDGRYGTLSEIALGKIYGKPVIGWHTWEIPGVEIAQTPEEAVELAWSKLK